MPEDYADKEGFVEVWDAPGLGVGFIEEEAKRHLSAEDEDFFEV